MPQKKKTQKRSDITVGEFEKLVFNKFNLTKKQKEFLKIAFDENTKIVFLSGFAGTGKTFLAIYSALQLHNMNNDYDILYVRTTAESAERSLGFLPGEAKSKALPFSIPLDDKLFEILGDKNQINYLTNNEIVKMTPVNFLRGSSWKNKIVVMDECISEKHYILTDEGNKNIKYLFELFQKGKKLPLALSANEKTGDYEYKEIKNVVYKGKRETVKVTAANKKFYTTPDHLFFTEKGWIEAKDLNYTTPIISSPSSKHQILDVMNDDQLQVFMGSYLGDGGVCKHGLNQYRLKIIHGEKQQDYLKWKAKIFQREEDVTLIEKNGWAQTPAFRFTTKCFALPFEINETVKTECPVYIVRNLDARGLAIWCMDDGSVSQGYFSLHTESFSHDSHIRFLMLFMRFDLTPKIRNYSKNGKKYYYLSFSREETKKLYKIIAPYFHEDIFYKLDKIPEKLYEWTNEYLDYNVVVPKKVTKNLLKEHVYDLEIKDNHNFFITSKGTKDGVLVHNCQNATFKELTTVITRIGENCKIFLCGDPMQSDINGKSGFADMLSLFEGYDSEKQGIHVFKFFEEDIMRSEILKFIVKKIENRSKNK